MGFSYKKLCPTFHITTEKSTFLIIIIIPVPAHRIIMLSLCLAIA